MTSKYIDNYYDHFSKYNSKTPPVFERDRNYMMRFCTPLSSYRFDNSNLTIVYFKHGSGEFQVGNKKLDIDGGKFIVVNPGLGWEFTKNKSGYLDVLGMVVSHSFKEQFNYFSKASLPDILEDPFHQVPDKAYFIEYAFRVDNYRSGKLIKAIHKLSNNSDYEHISPEELCIEVLHAIYKDQNRGYDLATHIEAKKSSTKLETLRRLLIANDYIHDNLMNTISLEDLTRVSTLSRYHLYYSFKTVYGNTPHQYINRIKMAKAKAYIREGQCSLSEIADLLGYNDLSVFGKVFKKVYGRSPSHYKVNS